jgi:2-methylisoborneol synthase
MPGLRTIVKSQQTQRATPANGTATVLVNDLHSVARDATDDKPVCNMVLQLAADRQSSIEEAIAITVDLHNNLVRDFQATHRSLLPVPSPQLQRFLRGARAWMGGSFEWHTTNPRYQN